MRIAIGCDHRGLTLKQTVISLIALDGHTCEDFGTYDNRPVDYPDIARRVAEAVAGGKFDCGILTCGTGIGMSIAANKIKGIRAAVCHDSFSARMSRQHNAANILCLGSMVLGPGLAEDIVKAYLSSTFEGGRHQKRVEKIKGMEEGSQ